MDTVVLDPKVKWGEEEKVVQFVDSDESEGESSGEDRAVPTKKAPELVYADQEDVVGGFNYIGTEVLKADDPWLQKRKAPVIRDVVETKGEEGDRPNMEGVYRMLNDMKIDINKRY